jgi:hypothetical protein
LASRAKHLCRNHDCSLKGVRGSFAAQQRRAAPKAALHFENER